MSYVDLASIHDPQTGQVAPAAWGDQIRENQEFFIDPPAVSVFNSGEEFIGAGGAFNDLLADSENFDNDAMHSTVSNTERITAQTAGRFLFIATVRWAADATGERQLQLQVNGITALPGLRLTANTVANAATALTVAAMVTLTVGDFVTCQARQTSGSNIGVRMVEFGATYMTR